MTGSNRKRQGIAWRIARQVGRAIGEWGLIEDGDRIMVAVSGGKDSFALLHHLHARRSWAPIDYTLVAAHVRVDPTCGTVAEHEQLQAACERLGVPLHEADTAVRPDERLRARGEDGISCHRCATARRQALFRLARELDTNKLALGHHLDDIVETVLMNLLFQGNFSTMLPRQPLFDGGLVLIRPFALVAESEIIRYVEEELRLPRQPGTCPLGAGSERARMKALVTELARAHPRVRESVFAAVGNVKTDYLL